MESTKNNFSDYLSKNAKLIDRGYFFGKLFRVSWFPGAILDETETKKVFGSVYAISKAEEVFKNLDDYEGVEEGLYKCELVNVKTNDNVFLKCWVYLYNQTTTNLEEIPSGNFLEL